MRLVSCEITGFGKMRDKRFEFSEGLNAFCRENGWGKTTFSVFLKSMFYGMEYSRKHSLSERMHYMPWQGGVYGGNLTFATGEGQYRIERSFGKTDKEDTFALYDLSTGKPTNRYSSNLGEELFRVDRHSFEMSIFIPQSALETEMTDSMNAKMGNLSTAKDDMNQFDAAIGRIRNACQDYTRRSKVNVGKLEDIRQQLRRCERELEDVDRLNQAYEKQQEQVKKQRRRLAELDLCKKDLAKRILQQNDCEKERGAYQERRRRLEGLQKELEELDVFFASGMPPAEELDRVELDFHKKKAESLQLEKLLQQRPQDEKRQQWEEMFADGIPTGEQMLGWREAANRVRQLHVDVDKAEMSEHMRKQWEDLKRFFALKMPTEQELSRVEEKVSELSKLEGQIREIESQRDRTRERIKEQEEQNSAGGNIAKHILAVILFAGLAAGALGVHAFGDGVWFLVLEILMFAGACAFAAVYIIFSLRRRQERWENLQDQLEQAEDEEALLTARRKEAETLSEDCRNFFEDFPLEPSNNLQSMVNEIRKNLGFYQSLCSEDEKNRRQTAELTDDFVDAQRQLYTALEPYAKAYGYDLYENGGESDLLDKLRNDVTEYQGAMETEDDIRQLRETIGNRERTIGQFLSHYPLPNHLTVEERLRKMRTQMERYEKLEEQVRAESGEIVSLQDRLQPAEGEKNVEDLQRSQDEVTDEIAQINRQLTEEGERLSETARRLEALEETAAQRERLLELETEYEQKVRLLKQTEDYLRMAKERFLAEYMEPLQNGLQKYLKMLQRASIADFDISGVQLDMDLSIRILCQGSSKEREYFSRGYQDMAALCARFALLDVLYRKEQPMLILDDPFTNFDASKADCAMELLRYLAKDRQIVYYTCHESRMPR